MEETALSTLEPGVSPDRDQTGNLVSVPCGRASASHLRSMLSYNVPCMNVTVIIAILFPMAFIEQF